MKKSKVVTEFKIRNGSIIGLPHYITKSNDIINNKGVKVPNTYTLNILFGKTGKVLISYRCNVLGSSYRSILTITNKSKTDRIKISCYCNDFESSILQMNKTISFF